MILRSAQNDKLEIPIELNSFSRRTFRFMIQYAQYFDVLLAGAEYREGMTMRTDFKSDWEECYQIHDNWWNRRDTEKPLLLERKFKDDSRPTPVEPVGQEQIDVWWTDSEAFIDRAEDEMSYRIYEGAAFPRFFPFVGPGSLGLFLGAKPAFARSTVWYYPCFEDISEAQAVIDPSNKWWQWALNTSKRAMERSNGRYLVALPDIVEGLDILADLIGTDKVLYALADAPAEVHRMMREINKSWFTAYDGLYAIMNSEGAGSSYGAFELLCKGKTAKLQCDISAMLSPAMFDEFALPYLVEQANWLDRSMYHLDGPGAVQHLDSLCAIENLDCIQWSPGAGAPMEYEECWDVVYRKILDSGKGFMIWLPKEHADTFVKKWGTRGLFLHMY